MDEKIKFGFCLPIRIDAAADFCINLSVSAEKLGFDSVWASDHIVVPTGRVGRFSKVFYDPFVLLSAIASRTKKIKTGLSVLIAPYRNPLVAAKAVSTLDVISGGRTVLGVGAGWMKEEFDMLGADFEKRGAFTDELMDVCRELWANESPSFNGVFSEFSDIAFHPKPVSGGNLPIYVGGNGEKSMRRAAERGDGWQPTGISPEQYAVKSGVVRRIMNERGRAENDFVFSVRNRVSFGGGENDGSLYTFSGSSKDIVSEVKKFADCGVRLVLFDPEAATVDEIAEITERLSSEVMVRF